MSNSDNPRRGAEFQRQVKEWFEKHYEGEFVLEYKIPIGEPKKDHKFDIVNPEKKIAIECKRYTWTETGNVPSAKMGFANEAAFYLSFLPEEYDKIIVLLKSYNSKREETLAEYYYRINHHLLGDVKVAEFDPEESAFRIIGESNKYSLSINEMLGNADIVATLEDVTDDSRYEVYLENAVRVIEINAQTTSNVSMVSIDENAEEVQTSSVNITLSSSVTEIPIKVKSEAGTIKTYYLRLLLYLF